MQWVDRHDIFPKIQVQIGTSSYFESAVYFGKMNSLKWGTNHHFKCTVPSLSSISITLPLGIASGAEVPYHSILALNVRTEIAYGMSRDGCTALYLRNEESTFLAQNWDWQEEQQENLINLNIRQESKPSISMITEAGIIGKIGLNSSGVGVCLNAIRALGVDFERLPCHLALRSCLESESVVEAVATLQQSGVASACHILVADSHEAVGLECMSVDIVKLPTKSVLTHTNHLLKPHGGVEDKMALQDSPARLERIDKLVQRAKLDAQGPLTTETIRALLADEDNLPTAICRTRTRESSVATLFSIIIDLREPSAQVMLGRPSEQGEKLYLNPSK
jgi:isopenicillin-N N-acyltransferase-like protein